MSASDNPPAARAINQTTFASQVSEASRPVLLNLRNKTGLCIVLSALAFFSLGLFFLPHLGFEYDEVAFLQVLLRPTHSFFAARIAHHSIPLMQMSYAGSLKTWLYACFFPLCNPGPFAVRVPALLLASFTILLVGVVVRHCVSARAAVLTCALLATDLNFLLTSVFDWGPVALQNFLLTIALYFVLVPRSKTFAITCAAFACGLAFWDKAVFVWMFSGLALSGVIFGLGALRREATPKRLGFATLALLVGVAPLLVYNVKRGSQTVTANAKFSFAEIGSKFAFVPTMVNNQAFSVFFVNETLPNSASRDPAFTSALYRLGVRSHGASSWRFGSFAFLLLAGTIVARPERRRFLLWLAVAVVLAWLQAAMTKGAGEYLHHLVLLYPVLFLALGVSAEEIATRLQSFGTLSVALAGLSLCLLGLNVANAQYVDMQRFSPLPFWTDADLPLAQYLAAHKDRPILVADWGIATQADVRTRGALSLDEISFGLRDGAITDGQIRAWAKARSLIVLHTAGHAMFFGQNAKLALLTKAHGFRIVPVQTISDRGGHPMFEVVELSPVLP